MTIGIYKIKNRINSKCYVGQSSNIEARGKRHLNLGAWVKSSMNYPLYRAMRKYGKDAFEFSIIEICSIKKLNEREIFGINRLKSNIEGYNQTTNSRVSRVDEFSGFLGEIVNDLKKSDTTMTAIAKKYSVTIQTLSAINNGRTGFNESEDYPIRKKKTLSVTEKRCKDCESFIHKRSIRCHSCNNVFISKKHRNSDSSEYRGIPSEDILNSLVNEYPFVKIGEMYGVSDNAVRKGCKKYNIKYRRHSLEVHKQS